MSHRKIVIIQYNQQEVISGDKTQFNVYNKWIDEKREKPADYHYRINQCDVRHWIDKFSREYWKILLDSRWIKEAQTVYMVNQKFSTIFEDEMNEIIEKYQYLFEKGEKYFVRGEGCSLKYGKHGIGPYSNMRQILESVISSPLTHSVLRDSENICTLYLFPWNSDLIYYKEFRVFVYQNRINAISQQHLYEANPIISAMNDTEIENMVRQIVDYFETVVRERMTYLENYAMDLVFIGTAPYFIEVNPFGGDYGAGSALFNWQKDRSILESTGDDPIYFAYVMVE